MVTAIRAVYRDGQLQLLDPVQLAEGQEIRITILSEKDHLKLALADMIADTSSIEDNDESLDEEKLLEEIDRAFEGQPPLSDDIITLRRNGL